MPKKLKILYAEDDDLGAELTKIILEKQDFTVAIASDGSIAWKMYKEQKPDILLLDLNMPKKDGIEVIRLVRKNDQLTHIIIYTSHGEPEKEVAALDAGADVFINKETPPAILVAHLKRIYERIVTNMNHPHVYELSPKTTYTAVTRVLTIQGKTTRLPSTDSRFLQLLCAKNHEIAEKQYLLNGIWGKTSFNKDNELKKYASRARAFLKADPSLQIECKNGGYILISL